MLEDPKTPSETIQEQHEYVEKIDASGEMKRLSLIQAETFLESMRFQGYKGTAQAIGDLVDNSIEAFATRIDIVTEVELKDQGGKKKKSTITNLAIVDNGHGMIPEMLVPALSFGGTHRQDLGLLGKFGFGLPSASIFISPRVDVYSKIKGSNDWWHAFMDLEMVKRGELTDKKTGLVSLEAAKTVEGLPDFLSQHLSEQGFNLEYGTVVLLSDPDSLESGFRQPSKFDEKILSYLGRTYRNLLQGCSMYVNGKQVEIVDPLFRNPAGRYYDISNGHLAETRPFGEIELKNKNGEIGKIRARVSIMHPKFGYWTGAPELEKKRYSIMKENEGYITILRSGREIDVIRRTDYTTRHNTTIVNYDRHWTVELDFDPVLDTEFGITTAKQQITLSTRIWDILAENGLPSCVEGFRAELKKMRADLAKEEEDAVVVQPRASERAVEELSKFERSRSQNPEKRLAKAKENLLREAGKKAKAEKRETGKVAQELNEEARSRPYRVLFEAIEGGDFYRPELFGDQVRIYMNSRHPFFTDLYSKLDTRQKSGIQLMLFALGTAELDPSSQEAELFYPIERRLWSTKLANALTILDRFNPEADEASAREEEEFTATTEAAETQKNPVDHPDEQSEEVLKKAS